MFFFLTILSNLYIKKIYHGILIFVCLCFYTTKSYIMSDGDLLAS